MKKTTFYAILISLTSALSICSHKRELCHVDRDLTRINRLEEAISKEQQKYQEMLNFFHEHIAFELETEDSTYRWDHNEWARKLTKLITLNPYESETSAFVPNAKEVFICRYTTSFPYLKETVLEYMHAAEAIFNIQTVQERILRHMKRTITSPGSVDLMSLGFDVRWREMIKPFINEKMQSVINKSPDNIQYRFDHTPFIPRYKEYYDAVAPFFHQSHEIINRSKKQVGTYAEAQRRAVDRIESEQTNRTIPLPTGLKEKVCDYLGLPS